MSIITEAGTNKVDCFCLLESWIEVIGDPNWGVNVIILLSYQFNKLYKAIVTLATCVHTYLFDSNMHICSTYIYVHACVHTCLTATCVVVQHTYVHACTYIRV